MEKKVVKKKEEQVSPGINLVAIYMTLLLKGLLWVLIILNTNFEYVGKIAFIVLICFDMLDIFTAAYKHFKRLDEED